MVIVATKLNENHRPSTKQYSQLADLLKERHPQEFGTKGIRLPSGKQVAVAQKRGRGGARASEQLEKRLSYRYYEVFRRGKLAVSKEKGETEKKKAKGGRPKVLGGIDIHKLDPCLTQDEKEELSELLLCADDLQEGEIISLLKYDKAGALVQDHIFNQGRD
jgi:hypothetical protein